MSKSNSFKKSRKLALGIAVAMGCSFAAVAFADGANPVNDTDGLVFNTSITGDASEDTDYVTAGVIDQGNGSYNFKEDVTINSEVGALFQPSSSYTIYNRFVAPIYTAVGKDITINMNNNTLNINHIAGNEYNASKLVGLAAGQGSSLEINNAGNINVTFANEKGNNHTGALAYGGGKLIIHNGGENQDQKIFSFNGLDKANGKRGLYAETKKSDSGEESQIIIDGLVNIVAKDTSAYGGTTVSESYAVQADSAQIDIGGGKFVGRLEAKHTYNYGDMTRINVNTQKDNDGNVIGAADNVVQIDGDLRAKGSSSKKAAQVNVGLNGEDSYLRGNVIGTQSSNATLDNESAYDSTTKYGVNIYMDNGADWTGGAKGALTLRMHNGATWHGGSNAEKDSDAINHMSMTLDTGAVWYHNATHDIAVDYFTGGKNEAARGTIVMDGDKNITLSNYTGNTMVSFVRDSEYPTRVLGGNITIGSAAEGSVITLSTDNDGIDTSNAGEVSKVLNKLANKLTYTGAIDGAENNLDGYVQIAEGLTASSAALKLGDISFSAEDGKGSLKEGSVTPNVTYPEEQTKDNFTSQITGEWKQDKEYKLAGVLHTDNAVYDFSKDRSIITTAGTSVGAGRDLQLQLNNKSMSLNSGADAVKADAITVEFKNLDKLDIKAAGQALLAENGGKIILHNTGAVTADSAFVANGAGSGIKADGLTNITVGSGDAVKADAGSIELAGGTVKGDVTADNKGKISINANNNAAGSILTDITGNVLATAGSSVDIGLGTADSKLTGDVSTAGDAVINIYADMGIWTGNADGDNVNLHLNSSKAQWNNIGNSKLRSLKGNGGIINQTDANAGNIDVGDYSGNVVVNYKHTADNDTASNTLNNIKFGGGSLNIDKAAEGSSITLRTDNSDNLSYTETDNIEKLFRELSKKLYYTDAGSNPDNLSGHVEIAEGLTKVKVYGDINYGEHGQGNYKDGSIKRTDPEIIYGSSETAMMRGAKSAMASTALLWRSENSDMLQRMGDVRLDNEESGLWARYYGGKNSFDAKNTKYSTSFNAYQLGYDKQLDNNKLFGAAVSYNKGKNTYEMGGHGDGKAVSLSVYGSWNSDKGHYADVIVKGGKLDNDYTVYNDMGHKLEGDYDTWGLSLSAEYGRRMQMQNGFYIDPSVQFTVGRIAGADYSAASDFLDSKGLKKDMYVSQDAFTSAIGRIGLGMGKTTDKAMFYTKFALAHEFSGDFTTTFAAENEPTSSTAVDFGGTWLEWQLGGSMKVNDNSYVYATFEKKFGGDTGSNDWRLDAGLRWSF